MYKLLDKKIEKNDNHALMNKKTSNTIQRSDSYTLTQAANTNAIKEREYGKGQEIELTPFTSCIGVFAKNDDKAYGIHLVLNDGSSVFDLDDARHVKAMLTGMTDIKIIGQLGFWDEAVMNEITTTQYPCKQGDKIGAKIEGGELKIGYNGIYY